MTLKKNDFVEIEYTGRIEDTKEVFDTTSAEEAKKQGLYNPNSVFGPVTVCLGEGFVLKGLETRLVGKEVGEHEIELTPEEGFGKKSTKLIQLIPTAKFKSQNVVPVPGLQINIDGLFGIVRTVTGGRTVVDFNHPLSGRTLRYHVKVRRVLSDEKEKAAALFKWKFKIEPEELRMNEKVLTVVIAKELPKQAQEEMTKKIAELTDIEKVRFQEKEAEKKEQ